MINYLKPNANCKNGTVSKEINQSLIRICLIIVIIIYAWLYAYFVDEDFILQHFSLLSSFIIISILEFIWACYCCNYSDRSISRTVFRVLSNLIDNTLLAFAMIVMGHAGAPLFPVFLWITFGIGIRYGIKYLIFSAILNVISFSFVMYYSEAWHDENLLLLSIGLMTSLLVLPAYVYGLIIKLTSALESEKSANRFKKSFLANINHELRTPLNSILSLADLIRTHKSLKEVDSMAGMISASANSQLKIINSILEFSKIEAGEYKYEKAPFNLYSLICEVHQIILPQAINKNVNFYIFIDANCDQDVYGAYDQIKQILVNLVGNAVKFTEYGHVKLSVHSIQQRKLRQHIAFEIEDTGIGISDESQIDIFKPFVQANVSITKKYGGTGLGIAIANELATLLGGKLSLKSELDKGTIFTFELHLDKSHAPEYWELDNIQLLPLNIQEKHCRIIKSFEKLGVKIIKTDIDQRNINEIAQDTRTIMLLDANGVCSMPDSYSIIHQTSSAPLIAINIDENEGCNYPCAITLIKADFTEKQLMNAVRIVSAYKTSSVTAPVNYPELSHSINILIAEDDTTLVQIYKMMFASISHKVDFVADGTEALSALNENRYDIAILDMHLPGLSGLEIARQYKILNENIVTSLILLTADVYNIQEYTHDILLFDKYLSKPVAPIILFDAINKIISTKNLAQQGVTSHKDNVTEINAIGEHKSILNHEVIDTNIIIAGVDGLYQLIDNYDTEIIENLNKLDELNLQNNRAEISDILHKLKGASLSIGANAFGESTSDIINMMPDTEVVWNIVKRKLQNTHKISFHELREYLSASVAAEK